MKMNNEIKIGIMITVVLAILAVLTFRTGEINFKKEGYTIKVNFQMIDGISVNAPVMLNGYEVGHVEDINIVYGAEETKMELLVWLDQKAKLRKGAKAYVKNMGFMGEKYVGLTSGDAGGSYLPPGSNIIGQEPADLDRILIDGKDVIKEIKAASVNIKEAMINVNERLKKNEKAIDNIFANLDTTMANMVSITANVDERLTKNEEKIDSMMTHLHSSSVNLDQFSYDLKKNPWKLMYRSKEKRQKSIDLLKEE